MKTLTYKIMMSLEAMFDAISHVCRKYCGKGDYQILSLAHGRHPKFPYDLAIRSKIDLSKLVGTLITGFVICQFVFTPMQMTVTYTYPERIDFFTSKLLGIGQVMDEVAMMLGGQL